MGDGPAPVHGSPSHLTCWGPVGIHSACMWQPPWRMRQLLASGGRGTGMRGSPSIRPSGCSPPTLSTHTPVCPSARPGLTEARPSACASPGGGHQPHPGTAPRRPCSRPGRCMSADQVPRLCSWRGRSSRHGHAHMGPPLGADGPREL